MASEDVQKQIEKANMQLASGDYNKSYNTLKKLTKADPDVAEGWFGMAEAAIGIPKLTVQEIASFYQKACDLAPEEPLYFASYGNFCFENGILKKGEECFQKAAEIDEENAPVYLSDLATSYFFSAQRFRNHYPNMTDDEIIKTSLKYIMLAFDIDKDKAKKLIDTLQ
jgi:Tfp pilus assembly protein PilF